MATDSDESYDEMLEWLTERVTFYLDRDEPVDPDVPLAEFGVDSIYTASIVGEVEERYGLTVDPTAAWDHPTVAALTKYLHERLAAG
ncbi:acyl carrier protein [Asanoa sp. WMMD1127]|uniref:acyl carrier protein n=1 Tax=Asanoa sp. WMMD1127 TaxID=3016107 RepID=UPI0024159C0B|nr:acyl carrier protein [Asanoa sp. WMMD1127]MDG4820786.1 acyl carrier protein [Asanoa sp. WMMD1127]